MAGNAGRGHLVKIAQLSIRRLQGVIETDGPMWEERLVRPIDIYPEYRTLGRGKAASRSSRTSWADAVLPRDPHRRGRRRHRRPALAGGRASVKTQLAADRRRQGPARDRAALGPDAPHPGAWPPGRPDGGDLGRRLRALGHQGQGRSISRYGASLAGRRRERFPPMPRCSASRSRIRAASASAPSPTREAATPRRNGSSATAR